MSACCRHSFRIAVLTLAFALCACGSKGDLVRPTPAPAATPTATPQAAEPAPTPGASTGGSATH